MSNNGKQTPPLWLPRGSVRALLAIFTTFAFLFLIIMHPSNIAQDGVLATLVVVIWERYFQARGQSNPKT